MPSNDYSKGSLPKAILSLALPMTTAQLINILYNLVDRMYIGRIPGTGRLELTGLGLTLPIISILMGFANLCGMGGAPLFSIHRGKGETEEAESILGNSFSLLLLFGVVVTGILMVVKTPMLYLFGASDVTFPYANDYLTIYLTGTVFVMIGLGMNPFINAQGFGKIGMMTVALGAILNIVLDPIFIFALQMNIKGAALATVLSQGCSALWVLHFLTGKKALHRLRWNCMKLSGDRVKRIISLGLSGFFMNLTNSLVQVVCNATLVRCGGDLYVGVMTVVNSIREVTSMPISGLTNGAQPVLGFNYGAQAYQRVRQGIRFTTTTTVSYAVFVWLLTMTIPEQLIRIFNDDPELIQAGIPALRIYFCLFLFMSLQISGQSVFVSLGKAKRAVFFSLFRKAIVNAPLTVLLAIWMGTTGVFVAEAVSQLLGGLACFITMYITVYRPLGRMRDGTPLQSA